VQEEKRLSLREAADALGVSDVTTRRWIKSGKLKAYQPGRKYLIPRSAVDELLESGSGKAQAPPSPEQPDFNGLLEEERRRAEREKLIEALPGWIRAAVEDEEFVQRFDAAKSSLARAKDLLIRQREETGHIIALLRELKERDAPAAELQAAKRDLAQARARETACTIMDADLWRGRDVADVRPVDIVAEVAAAQGDLGAFAREGRDDFASEAG
jgi:excisionase family DNA binding protein